MDYQLGEIAFQENSLKQELISIGQALNFNLLGDWETKVREYLADLQAGLESLNVIPQTEQGKKEIFDIKRQIVNTLARRVTIDRNRELQVDIRLNLINLGSPVINGKMGQKRPKRVDERN